MNSAIALRGSGTALLVAALLWTPAARAECASAARGKSWNAAVAGSNIWLMSAVDRFPSNDPNTSATFVADGTLQYFNINTARPYELPARTTMHFHWNQHVIPHAAGNWECHKYALVDPASAFAGHIWGGRFDDTMVIHKHRFSANSFAVVPQGEVAALRAANPHFPGKWVAYDRDPALPINDVGCPITPANYQTYAAAHYAGTTHKTIRRAIDDLIASLRHGMIETASGHENRGRDEDIWIMKGCGTNSANCAGFFAADDAKPACAISLAPGSPWLAASAAQIGWQMHHGSVFDSLETVKGDFNVCIERPESAACKYHEVTSAAGLPASDWFKALQTADRVEQEAAKAYLSDETKGFLRTLAAHARTLVAFAAYSSAFYTKQHKKLPAIEPAKVAESNAYLADVIHAGAALSAAAPAARTAKLTDFNRALDNALRGVPPRPRGG